jgi:nitroreductase
VTSKKLIQELAATKPEQTWIATAPVILVFLGDSEPSATKFNSEGQSLYTVQDATIACTYAQLAAADEGLGACWVGTASVADEVRKVLGLQDTLRPMALLPIGYAGGPPLWITTRRPTEEMVIEFDE